MSVTAKSSRARVKPGRSFKYTVRLQNPKSLGNKKAPLDLTDLALRVELPPGARYIYPKNAVMPKPGRGAGIITPELMDGILTLPLTSLRGKSAWTIKMKIVTARNTTAPSSLTMSASVVQISGVLTDVCPRAANTVTVAVV